MAIFFILSKASFALVPLDNLLLGEYSNKYSEDKKDPISFIFKDYKSVQGFIDPVKDKNFSYKKRLGSYRGMFEEAYNLENFCASRPKVQYPINWDRQQAKRSVLATLQYIGLDISLRSMAKYAKYFEFSKSEYKNLSENLVGNYCTQNLSIISIRQLKKNFTNFFNNETKMQLPSIKGNPLFSDKLDRLDREDVIKKKEFLWTIELFKTFCSWPTDSQNLRLLVPLVRNPVIMSYIIRQLSGKRVVWDFIENKIYQQNDNTTLKMNCQNLVCRKVTNREFQRRFPRSVGSSSIQDDLKRLYCQDFRDVDYQIKDQPPKIQKLIKSYSMDDQILLGNQFLALLTGVPDFIIQSSSYDSLKKVFSYSLDKSWNDWANIQNNVNRGDLYYEESLTIELIDRSFYFSKWEPKFRVEFDVNMGEFDRSVNMVGKLKAQFKMRLSKRFLSWARRHWKNVDLKKAQETEKVLIPFRTIVQDQFANVLASFETPPWKGDLEGLVMQEVLEQITRYEGRFFEDEKGFAEIPVVLNYGPFALKYLREKYQAQQNEGKRLAKIKRLNDLRL